MTGNNAMTPQISAYPLRMPTELREWFEAVAKQNDRSLNSELVRRLLEIKAAESQPSVKIQS